MTKAKRKINKFNFEEEGAHVALVTQAANQQTVLMMKSKDKVMVNPFNIPQDDIAINKALEQVEIKLSMEEFLRKFFDMWYSDAELLTAMLGMKTETEYWQEQNQGEDYKSYIEDKLESFSIMKSLNDKEISEISFGDYLNIVKTQQTFEKNNKEENMAQKDDTTDLQKSVADLTKQLADLQKANDELAREREAVLEKSISDKIEGFSFASDHKEDLVKLFKQFDTEAQTLVFTVLEKAAEAIDASVSEELTVEGEATIEKSDKDKDLTKSKLQAKYTLSDK